MSSNLVEGFNDSLILKTNLKPYGSQEVEPSKSFKQVLSLKFKKLIVKGALTNLWRVKKEKLDSEALKIYNEYYKTKLNKIDKSLKENLSYMLKEFQEVVLKTPKETESYLVSESEPFF